MRYPRTTIFLCAYFSLLLQSHPIASEKIVEDMDFSYSEGSGTGPNILGSFHENWTKCRYGKQQSPIDVNNLNVKLNQSIGSLMTGYNLSIAVMKNIGYYVVVEWPKGGGSLVIDGKNYILQQCHWHSPSEHTLNGNRYPLELHMVHRSSDNETAVVGIIYVTGQPDPFLSSKMMWHLRRLMDAQQNEEPLGLVLPPVIVKDAQYYRYQGSLTTPPCTEGVVWILIEEIKTVSKDQLDLLRAAVHWNGNARPIQPLNERIVSLYKPWHDEYAWF